jgi:hypothetical protein
LSIQVSDATSAQPCERAQSSAVAMSARLEHARRRFKPPAERADLIPERLCGDDHLGRE